MLIYMKQYLASTRNIRKYAQVILRLVTIAILAWILLFNLYTLIFRLQTTKATTISEKNKINNFDMLISNLTPPKIIDSKSLDFFKRIQRQTYNVKCKSLIEWDENETRNAKRILHKLKSNPNQLVPILPDSNFVFNESQCDLFKELRGYNSHFISEFEQKFPLAFIILTYNNAEQFERLLRVIYRPQNVYCIHVDSKSSSGFIAAIRSITRCFKNVFISTKLERIVYASYTRLKADVNCMNDLTRKIKSSHPNLKDKSFNLNWKYLINVASTEFPLRTNYELTKILNMFNGANDIEVMTNFQKERVLYQWKIKRAENSSHEYMVRTKKLKSEIPHNYTIVKGIAYCTFSRQFVEYALNNVYAKNLLKWSEDTYSPDEWYWATLQYNVQFSPPGGFRDLTRSVIPTRSRFIGWKNSYKCMGQLIHNICIFSLEDLPELVTRKEFFLNKFMLEFDPVSVQCMEEWLNSKITLHQTVDMIYYCRLLFVIPYSINPSCARLIKGS